MNRKLLSVAVIGLFCLGAAGTALAQTCQELHNLGTSGCAPSSMEGANVTLTGFVYTLPGTFNSGSVYFKCSSNSGGMTFFDPSLDGVLNESDEISVTGDVAAFGDEIQLENTTVTVLSNNNVVLARPFGTGDLADGTDLLGDLMIVQGLLAKTSSGFNSVYTVDDGSGPVIVFVDGTTGIDTGLVDALLGDVVTVAGATKCFDGVGEILPRRQDDISLLVIPTQESNWGSLKAQFE